MANPSVKGTPNASTTTSVTIPTHAIGDLIVIWAYRDGSTTVPSKPAAAGTVPAWADIDSSSGTATNSGRTAYFVATATNHTSGTWSNATGMVAAVIQNQASSLLGGHAKGGGTAANSSTAPAITQSQTTGKSLILEFYGHRTVTAWSAAPSGYTRQVSNTTEVAMNTKDSSTSDGSIAQANTASSSGYYAATVEILGTETSPTVALSTPADTATGVSTTPDLVFTGTDSESDDVRYEVQIYKEVATDNFNRADAANLGANWSDSVESIANAANADIVSNQAVNDLDHDNDNFWNANSFANNQYSQITVKTIDSGTDAFSGVLVRGNASDYVFAQMNKFSARYQMYWYNGGAYTSLGTYDVVPAVNDVLRLEAIGTTFNFYLNGILRITATNGSAPSSGSPGFIVSGSTDAGNALDDWSGGDIIVDVVSGTDAGFSNPTPYLMDSYPNSNDAGGTTPLSSNAAQWQADGQSINGTGEKLYSVKWRIKKDGSPTGNAVAKVYAHSGTYGTSSVPTGAALATSANLDVSTLTTSMQDIEFLFSGANQITLTSGTKYFISIEYSGGDASNCVRLATDNTSPTHAGNEASYQSSAWTAASGYDNIFYLYTYDLDTFLSGQAVTYTVQSALSNSTLYYWRVRGKDPTGSNTYGTWATTRSFTTASGGGSSIKTINGLAIASVKTVNGLAIASIKTFNGLA